MRRRRRGSRHQVRVLAELRLDPRHRVAEVAQASPEAAPHLGQPLGPEDQQRDEQDEQQVRRLENVAEHVSKAYPFVLRGPELHRARAASPMSAQLSMGRSVSVARESSRTRSAIRSRRSGATGASPGRPQNLSRPPLNLPFPAPAPSSRPPPARLTNRGSSAWFRCGIRSTRSAATVSRRPDGGGGGRRPTSMARGRSPAGQGAILARRPDRRRRAGQQRCQP